MREESSYKFVTGFLFFPCKIYGLFITITISCKKGAVNECYKMKAFPIPNREPSEYEKLKFTRAYQPNPDLIAIERPLRLAEIRRIVREFRNNGVGSFLAPLTLGGICTN